MPLLVIIFLVWLCVPKRTTKRRTQRIAYHTPRAIQPAAVTVYKPTQPTPAEIRRRAAEQERERKREEARRQAEQDLIHYDVMKEQYIALYDLLEAERDEPTTTPARRAQLQRQIITLNEKLYKNEQRMNKAYYVARGI